MRRKQEELSPSPQRKLGFPLSEILPVSPRFARPSHALAQSGLPRYALTPPGLPPATAALRLPCGALLGPSPPLQSEADGLCFPREGGPRAEGSSEAAAAGSGEVAPRQGQVTTLCSARPSDPSPRLCSANKAGADNPEKALVPAEGNPKEGDAKTPHNSRLLRGEAVSWETELGRFSRASCCTRAAIMGPWQAAERAPTSSSPGTHE